MPSRFKKDIVRAATLGAMSSDVIAVDGLQRVLMNIGAAQQVSESDVHAIFNELGDGTGKINSKTMLQII
jgi:hypothetical protein